ncbi:cystatin-A5-like [Pangasianodon hypophthalmus]|uniref:cystatin-A5-like n=1 Tax=Pangasianodon hypophthalmus TaxID=310915 RepID=UPI0023082460|nr:cystatin-A5-like [Pangasianodon hypophthalmus]
MCTMVIAGGWSEWMEVTEEVKKICLLVKPEAEKKTKRKFPVYLPLTYRHQVVAGTNYIIKVYVGNDSCLIMKVFQGLGSDAKLELLKAKLIPLPSIILL